MYSIVSSLVILLKVANKVKHWPLSIKITYYKSYVHPAGPVRVFIYGMGSLNSM